MTKLSPSNQSRQTQLTITALGGRGWRQQVGLSWMASPQDTLKPNKPLTVILRPGDVLLRNARPLKTGTVGMCDNGGFVPVVVTPEMVGQTVAISLWIEDKSGTGRTSPEQKAFIQMVRRFGGRAGVSRGDEDTRRIIAGEILD